MSITHKSAARVAMGDAVVGAAGQLGSNGKLVIYSGTPPANADAALAGNVAIATITGLNFGGNVAGVSTVTSSTADPAAVGGTAAFFRLTTTATAPVIQGLCATSASDLTMSNLTIAAGANVSLNAGGTYTAPP